MSWWELSQEDRIKEVYSKYTLEQFFNWWQGGTKSFMEIRIKDFKLIKKIHYDLSIPYSLSGVYVNNLNDLKRVIKYTRDIAVMWFGINSRKKNYNRWGNKSFGGSTTNVDTIQHLFIDIDRAVKEGAASNDDLGRCNELADKILERLGSQGWNKNYCKICSGNGIQLLIKFDYPIQVPRIEYDGKNKVYIEDKEYINTKNLLRAGIGHQLVKFSRKFKKDLNAEVDDSCFKLACVGALPFTKNFKYGGFTWRGIVELKEGVNEGFTDYVLNCEKEYNLEKKVFDNKPKLVSTEHLIKKGHIMEHPLAKLLTTNVLPKGERNSKLWFMVKCLLRDSNIDLTSEEFRNFHRQVQLVQKDNFPLNLPDKQYSFSEDTINNYCIQNCIPLVYKLKSTWNKKRNVMIDGVNMYWREISQQSYELPIETTIFEDLNWFKSVLKEGMPDNDVKTAKFINACIIKYGEDKTKYYVENVFVRWLCYE